VKNRTLTLGRESLTELTPADLSSVVGAEAPNLPTMLNEGIDGLGYCLTFKGSHCIY
jgi:hypothetical protein